MAVSQNFERTLACLRGNLDIIDARVIDPAVRGPLVARGWEAFLLGLDDCQLQHAERQGLQSVLENHSAAPAELVALGAEARHLMALPTPIPSAPLPLEDGTRRTTRPPRAGNLRASDRKSCQIADLVEFVRRLRPPTSDCEQVGYHRVVDIGTGRGLLAYELASALDLSVWGIERSAERVDSANRHAPEGPTVRFSCADVLEDPPQTNSSDLVLGLHACGELGDAAVRSAESGGSDLILVSCCLQKQRGRLRLWMSARGRDSGLSLSKDVLGLSNTSAHEVGVEVSWDVTISARERRYCLRLFLLGRGLALDPGEEMRGINRRQARKPLASLLSSACAKRSLDPPTSSEIEHAEATGRREFAVIRRLSLVRTMLARPLELACVLDRACFLEEAGYDVEVGRMFTAAISPRNLAIVARSPTCARPI